VLPFLLGARPSESESQSKAGPKFCIDKSLEHIPSFVGDVQQGDTDTIDLWYLLGDG
jgi:hypothetical protein